VNVLIVGTTPPGGGAFARALAAVATARREAGDTVETLAPNPESAAHRSGRLDGVFLAARLAWASRRFDAVELRIEPGLPCRATTSRATRAVYLLALGAALARYSEVTLRPDTPIPIPGGLGGRATRAMWAAATRIVVWNTDDEAMALRTPGVHPDRVEIASRPAATPHRSNPWPAATDPDLRASVLDVIRERADADRRAVAGRDLLGADAAPPPRPGPSSLGVARLVLAVVGRRAARGVRRSLS
jgi:hypothetical protein